MTSANPPNQPIVKDNEEALKILGGTVDYFLFHNRKIAHRCDDSVMRVHGSRPVFLRRSRGYAPAPIRLKAKAKRCVVGLGGELNNTACVLLDDKAFISQHIGDVENVETREFPAGSSTSPATVNQLPRRNRSLRFAPQIHHNRLGKGDG